MKEYIEKEILRQLQLIKFDRSKTLLEQNVKNKKDVSKQTKTPEFKPIDFKLPRSPHYGEEIDTTLWFGGEKIIVFRNGDKYYADDMTPFPNYEHMKFDPDASKREEEFYKKNPCLVDSYTDGDPDYYDRSCPGRSAFYLIRYNIEGNGYWFSSWGTDENELIDALEMLKTKKDYEDLLFWIYQEYPEFQSLTVTQWIQANEFSQASKYSAQLKSIYPGQSYQYNTNDYYLEKIEKILQKFNSNEEFSYTDPFDADSSFQLVTNLMLPPAALAAIHTVLPLVSVLIAIIPGGQSFAGYLAAMSVELLDASLYAVVDRDPYMAGLTIVFAFAGRIDMVFGTLALKYGNSVIKNLAVGRYMAAEELQFFTKTISNLNRYTNMSKYAIRYQGIKNIVLKAKTIGEILRFGVWLSKKGYAITGILVNMGFTVGKGFITWEAINQMFTKYCRSFSLKDLDKTKTWILQQLSAVGPYFQPFSSPCVKEETEELLATVINEFDIKAKIKTFLEKTIKNNIKIGLISSGLKNDIAYIQYILFYLKLSFIVPNQKKVDAEVEKGVKWSKEKCETEYTKMISGGGLDMYKMGQHPECEQYFKPSDKGTSWEKIVSDLEWEKLDKTATTYLYGQIGFNWGTYDKFTEDMIKEFQKRYKLKTVDGIFGSETAKKMLELLNGGKLSGIKEYSNEILTSKDEIETLKKRANERAKEIQENRTSEEKEIIKGMHETNVEEKKKDILNKMDQIERFGYDNNALPDINNDTITEEIGAYNFDKSDTDYGGWFSDIS